MSLKAIEVYPEIEESDIRFLKDLERASSRFELIPEDRLPKISRMHEQDIEYHLGRLNKYELLEKDVKRYEGYRILPSGYDLLALWSLSERKVLKAFGKPVGIGKEADTYDALTPEDKKVAVKFNRLGLTFSSLTEKRSYHPKHGWIDASKKAARREFKGLKKVYPKVEVPKPVAFDRHVLVTGLIEGEELSEIKNIDYPELVLSEILRNAENSLRCGVIHGDLSEHNIIIKPNGEILIIDWPQWEPLTHPEADELIERDIKNVLSFFRRKFRIKKDLEETLREIKN
ncbi:MAG: RIO1 family regulatory kinase/ATPase [Candidatus Hadarchaeia archaeon]